MNDGQKHLNGLTLIFSSWYTRWIVLKKQYSQKVAKEYFHLFVRILLLLACYERSDGVQQPGRAKKNKGYRLRYLILMILKVKLYFFIGCPIGLNFFFQLHIVGYTCYINDLRHYVIIYILV